MQNHNSTMTTRMDNQKCGSVVGKLNSLGNSGFHLNGYGASRHPTDWTATIRNLWKSVGYPKSSSGVKPAESTNAYVFKTLETTEGQWEDDSFEVINRTCKY